MDIAFRSRDINNSGRIEINTLIERLNEYLQSEGHQTDIADKLFTVMKERVCALVSRLQGTFEFEVQPLREYFCAKYLYKTAPYSTAGNSKHGTKTERFDAISRNFYWQNVVRFFAGCFDKGELPMLIQKINELQDHESLKYTNYPQIITAQLLSDWVFTQYPNLLSQVIKIIVNGINIGSILNQDQRTSNESIVLPLECGRKEMVLECFNQLQTFPKSDISSELIAIINNNPYNTLELWSSFLPKMKDKDLTNWLEYGYLMQIIHKIEENILLKIIEENASHSNRRLQILINGNRIDLIENNKQWKEKVFNGILEGELSVHARRARKHLFTLLSSCANPFSLGGVFNSENERMPFFEYLQRRGYYNDNQLKIFDETYAIKDEIDQSIHHYFNSIRDSLQHETKHWIANIEPWDELVEKGRLHFNNAWIFYLTSIIAAGIKSKYEKKEEYSNFNDENISLCKRVLMPKANQLI